MLKTLFAPYKNSSGPPALAALFTALEVVMEVLLPPGDGPHHRPGDLHAGQMDQVVRYGVLMLVAAFLSLAFGVLSSRFAARASAGYACNLRESLFAKVQTFSFSNIDKFSTAGLVTRMTTDVTNLQNAFMVILRIGIRSPLMLLASPGPVPLDQPPAEPGLPGGHGGAGGGPGGHHGGHPAPVPEGL